MDDEAVRTFYDVTSGDLGQIRQYVRETAVSHNCAPEIVDELIVAVNEAAANIIRHGFKNRPGAIRVAVICGENALRVLLTDNSPGFDPTTVASPDTTLPLEERPFGGLGVHMMRSFCDELSYRQNSRGENELTLVKRTSRPQ